MSEPAARRRGGDRRAARDHGTERVLRERPGARGRHLHDGRASPSRSSAGTAWARRRCATRSWESRHPARRARSASTGEELVGVASHKIARRGIGYVPQGRRLFPSLTVDQHLRIAARGAASNGSEWTRERVYELFPRLAERKGNGGAQLSGGEQQMLAIGRALVTNPTDPRHGRALRGPRAGGHRGAHRDVQAPRGGGSRDPPHRAEPRRRDRARRAPARHDRRQHRGRDDGARLSPATPSSSAVTSASSLSLTSLRGRASSLAVSSPLLPLSPRVAAGCGGDDPSARTSRSSQPGRRLRDLRDGADGEGERRLTAREGEPESGESRLLPDRAGVVRRRTKSPSSSGRSGSRRHLRHERGRHRDDDAHVGRRPSDTHPTWSPPTERHRVRARRRHLRRWARTDRAGDASRTSTPRNPTRRGRPTAHWIAYVRRTPGTPVQNVWVMQPDGSESPSADEAGRPRVHAGVVSRLRAHRLRDERGRAGRTSSSRSVSTGRACAAWRRRRATTSSPPGLPTARRIAYQEAGAIFTVELGGGEVERLTDSANNDSSPAWNPVSARE